MDDEKTCHLCPCSRLRTECTDFQKILDLQNPGVVIYRHSTRIDETIYMSSDIEPTTNDVFIVHNTKDAELTSSDIVPALVENKVDCPRCQHIMEHAQKLLQNVSTVGKQDVVGICDHCKMKEKFRSCVECTKIVKKFMTSVHIRGDYEETKERVKTWLTKIQTMLKGASSDEKESKIRSRSQTDLRIDAFRKYSQRAVHVPHVEAMFRPERLRPTSGKEEPSSKFVYFRGKDEKSLYDIKSKVQSTSVDNLVQPERADEDDIETIRIETKESILSAGQKKILKEQPSSVVILASKPRHVEHIKSISSVAIAKSKLPKDLGAESKVNVIKPEKSKSRQTIKSSLKRTKASESRLRIRKYHSEEALTTTIADVRKHESKISKKGFKYFFPKDEKADKKRPKSDLTSSVLIKDTQDRLKDQEIKKLEARKRKAEESEQKMAALEEKKRAKKEKKAEEKLKKIEAEAAEDGKKLKKVKSVVTREAAVKPEKETRADLEKKSRVFKSKIQMKESTTDRVLTPVQKEVKKIELDRKEKEVVPEVQKDLKTTKEDQDQEDKSSVTQEKSKVLKEASQASKKELTPIKEIDSQVKEKSTQEDGKSKAGTGPAPKMKEAEKKGDKQKGNTEMDMLKKALESQKTKTEAKPQEKKPTPEKPQDNDKIETVGKVKKDKDLESKDIQSQSKKDKDDKEPQDKNKGKRDKEESEALKKALDKKNKDEMESKKKAEAEKKAKELNDKKALEAPKIIDMSDIPPPPQLITESEQSALGRLSTIKIKDVDMKDVRVVRQPSYDDLILRLVRLKKAAATARKNRRQGKGTQKDLVFSTSSTQKHKEHKCRVSTCEFCLDSDLELDLDSFLRRKEIEEEANIAEMILGDKIIKKYNVPPIKKEDKKEPLFFMSAFDELPDKMRTVSNVLDEFHPSPPAITMKGSRNAPVDQEAGKGVIRYALSNRTFIEKGWTLLPTEKVVRKMNVYRMRPAHPEFDWFEHNKNKRLIPYDTGEKFAEFDDNGRGRWYYRNGRLALDYYDAEEINAQQRFVIYSSGELDERGRSRPITILATFDYLGNGVVFDHGGKIRLKYNQTEGVVLDRAIGPVSHWKWHTLNDPPVLQQVMIDTHMAQKDPDILKLGGPTEETSRTDNEEMLAIEFDNFIKEKSKKSHQKFKPFQIKMKALKINEYFSLRVLDQATVYLIYRDGSTNLKLNIGMLLDHQEIVDTDTAEVGEVSNNVERCPARSDSLAALQRSVAFAQHYERMRTERERRLRPLADPCASVEQLTAGTSRPLRPPLLNTRSSNLTNACHCKSRKPTSNNLYYDTRLV